MYSWMFPPAVCLVYVRKYLFTVMYFPTSTQPTLSGCVCEEVGKILFSNSAGTLDRRSDGKMYGRTLARIYGRMRLRAKRVVSLHTIPGDEIQQFLQQQSTIRDHFSLYPFDSVVSESVEQIYAGRLVSTDNKSPR